MKKLALVILVVALSCLCSCKRARIIPEDTLAEIYADMFMADQWIKSNREARKTADTTLFYESIFRKYGFTTKDYIASVDKYLYKAEDFSKVLAKASEIINDELERCEKMSELINYIEEKNSRNACGYENREFVNDSLVWVDTSVLWKKFKEKYESLK